MSHFEDILSFLKIESEKKKLLGTELKSSVPSNPHIKKDIPKKEIKEQNSDIIIL